MKQVFVDNRGGFVDLVPPPEPGPGELLVRVHYSCISIGTETAAFAQPGPAESGASEGADPAAPAGGLSHSCLMAARAAFQPAKCLRLGLKALRNPQKAFHVGGLLLQGRRLPQALAEYGAAAARPSALAGGAPHECWRPGHQVGYSAAGVVLQTGPATTRFAPGDLVACTGAGQANHAEYICVPENLTVAVPGGLPLREACTAALGAIAMQGVRRADLRFGETAVVLGLGLLGQLSLQMLRHSGVAAFGFDPDSARVERATAGGLAAGTADPAALERLVNSATGGQGADATIITAAAKSSSICQQAMELTRRKGRVVVVGDVGLHLQRAPFYAKEIDFLISCSYGPGRYDPEYEERGLDYPYAYVRWTENRNLGCYLRALADKQFDVRPLLDIEAPLAEVETVYARLVGTEPRPLGAIIRYPAAEAAPAPDRMDSGANPASAAPAVGAAKSGYALVGTGAFALSVLEPQFRKYPDCLTLRAVVGTRASHLRQVAHELGGVAACASLTELFEREKISTVCIATRHDKHAGQVVQALKQGCDVFCEKPLALDWDQLEQVAQAVQTSDRRLLVGFNRRFSPSLALLKERLGNPAEPLVIHYRLNAGKLPVGSWASGPEGGGRNLGEACHIYDVFGFLAGATPVSITAQAVQARTGGGGENENFVATLRFADGSLATLTYTSLGDTAAGKERLELYSAGRMFVLEDYCRLLVTEGGRTELLWQSDVPDKGHAREIERWAECLTGGRPSPIGWAEIHQATAIALWVEDLLHGRLGSHCAVFGGADR